MGTDMTRLGLAGFQSPAFGRWLGMAATSTLISATRIPLTRRMCRRIFPAGHTYILLLTRRMGKRQKHF